LSKLSRTFVVYLGKEKERKPQYGPSMVVGVVPTFKNFVVYLGKRKERKGEYGRGITYIREV
jgi:hypothetical protein